ncbi:MAG: response regulator transcription factor [Planctomycetota bacterium]
MRLDVTADNWFLQGTHVPDIVEVQQSRSWFGGNHLIGSLKNHKTFTNVPIVVLGGEDEVLEVVVLTLGADEFVAWPVSIEILMARFHAIHQRRSPGRTGNQTVVNGPVTVDSSNHVAMRQGETLTLNRPELALLREIIANGEMVTRRSELARVVLGVNADPRDRRIDVHVSTLRKKLGRNRDWLRTIRAVGFAWRDPQKDESPA